MPFRGISSRIALPFALFVAFGSLFLAVWLTERERRDSREAFASSAETNARFIARSNWPLQGQLAESLASVLELGVEFEDLDSAWAKDDEGEVMDLGGGREAIICEIRPGDRVRFTRKRPAFAAQLFRVSTLVPLVVFWGLSLVLAAVISRRLVRPIRLLADGVGNLGAEEEKVAEFPGADRRDELGQLSRALTETHARLIEERQRREEGERAALLGKMATGLAHEIRNPVAAVRLHAQLLESCERCSASAGTIVSEAETIEGLVNQWMFLSKPEPPERRLQDVGELLEHCIEALGPAARHASVEIKSELPGGLESEVDAARIGQVFRNVLMNGIHAMPEGGQLAIAGCRGDGERLEFRFRDQGAGFSKEALGRYGELFFTTKEGGMGVGLSVSSEIVRAHGGTLEVGNSERGGAEVLVSIPIHSEPRDL